jgi:hypothetical protein
MSELKLRVIISLQTTEENETEKIHQRNRKTDLEFIEDALAGC